MSSTVWAPMLKNLQEFVLHRGWTLARTGRKTEEYAPPQDFEDLAKDFRLMIPIVADAPDVGRFIGTATRTLAELYDYSYDQIEPVIQSADAVFSVRIEDETTREGSIDFPRFTSLVDQLRNLILHTSALVSTGDPLIQSAPPEAQIYLNNCRFLQTTRGSFVTNVQLPTGQIVPQAVSEDRTFDPLAVIDSLQHSLAYVSSDVLNSTEDVFTDAHLQRNIASLNVGVLNDIKSMVGDSKSSSFSFSLVAIKSSSLVETGTVTPQKVKTLNEYVKFVRDKVGEQFSLQTEGKVIELRSRNPLGARNYVLIEGKFEDKSTYIAATLNNEQYQKAVRAHEKHVRVRISGKARKLKTQLKIVSLQEFEDLQS